MYWADQIADKIIATGKHKPYWVDDMKTPSGVIHVGSLRGVMVHDLVHKALLSKGQESKFSYVFNDMDPMDSLPKYLDQSTYSQHMGKPFHQIPAPDGKSPSYAKQFAQQFIDTMQKLGASPEIIWSSELYESGEMNDVIRTALDNVETVRKVYKQVADQDKPKDWYPFQVICENCGRVGSTKVDDWDGETVHYVCLPNQVEWAKGCNHDARVSPFNGTGKLMWKVDWPAHWTATGISIEGAGKDHTSDGGSRDVANALLKKVFKASIPFDIPYEWFLIGGRKMSTSKGVGTSAHEFVEIIPPQIGRFLFVKNHYNRQINFDPNGDTILDLYDQYDECARAYWQKGDDKQARIFELSQLDGSVPAEHYLPRFRDIAKFLQDPKLELVEKFAELKESPLTKTEKEVLEERIEYAKIWLKDYAPQEAVLTISEDVPEEAQKLTEEQKHYLLEIIPLIKKEWSDPQELQQELFNVAKASLGARPAFQAIYLSLIGKTHGPKAAWFLLDNKEIAINRFQAIQNLNEKSKVESSKAILRSEKLSINPEFAKAYPTVSIGWAVIKGVSIEKSNSELEKEKAKTLAELENLTTEKISDFPEVQSYREMYKQMRVKYQSRRPSPEALLRRVAQGKGLYTVNTLVDAYNLVVMRNRVSVGAFDLDAVKFPTEIKIAQGGEKIHLLGDDEDTILKEGEVSYFDQEGPYNLDYNYRDAIRTSVKMETKDIWINVDGVGEITKQQVEKTLHETLETILKYCGGEVVAQGMLFAS